MILAKIMITIRSDQDFADEHMEAFVDRIEEIDFTTLLHNWLSHMKDADKIQVNTMIA